MVVTKNIVLEATTAAFIEDIQSKNSPPIYTLTPEEARAVLEKVQSSPSEKLHVKIEDHNIPGPNDKKISIRIFRPHHTSEQLPVVMYFHGGGWVMGSVDTHDRLVRELAVGAHAAVVFVNYSRSPEARFPVAIEEAYAATQYIAKHGKNFQLDGSCLAVAGDSAGGNMAIAVTLLAKERKGPKISSQVLFYPVTSADLNTHSYEKFAEGPWLTKPAMKWFWDAYESDPITRRRPLLSPLQIAVDQLKGLPPALVITAENDVLRDEGEEYAHRLMQAGVEVTAVRFSGTIHDFVLLNALADTPATRGAMALATTYLRDQGRK